MDTLLTDNTESDLRKNLHFFIGALSLLVLVGVVMVFSSSYIYAKETFGTSTHFFYRQLVFCGLGLLLLYFFKRSRFDFWYNSSIYLNIVASILVLLTFIPGIGSSHNGSHRWLQFNGFSFQPAELLKLTLLISGIYYAEKFTSFDKKAKIQNTLVITVPFLLLILQPDFGSFLICALLLGYIGFLSELKRSYFWAMVSGGIISLMIVLMAAPYRVKRIMTYIDPWEDAKGSGFQIIQSWLAFAHGSVWGQGIGNSTEKLFYLPESYNDFIFSVLGEELGFIGVLAVVVTFMVFIYNGFKISLLVKEKFKSTFIAAGVFLIGIQCFLNMGVVLGLLPTKGLNLPFISYGGSSLLVNFMIVGLILSACRDELFENSSDFSELGKRWQDERQHTINNPINRPYPQAENPSMSSNEEGFNVNQPRRDFASLYRTKKPEVKTGFKSWSQKAD